MLSFILLAAPLGVVIGYSLTGVVISYGYSWRYSFFVQGIVIFASALIVMAVPSKYIDID
jgi:MFS family permease